MPEVTAWPAFDVERSSVRVVVLDADGSILLFSTIEPTMPALGEWWELPGGGMEPGETYAQTAVRELFEETGFRVPPESVSSPTWRRSTTYVRRGVRIYQHEVVVMVRLGLVQPEPQAEGRTPQEREEYIGYRWWPVADIRSSRDQRFFPSRLPDELESFLAGTLIHEPFDHWN